MIINFRDFIINFDKVESIETYGGFFTIYLTNKIYGIFNEKYYQNEWLKNFNAGQYTILPEEDFKDFSSLLKEWSEHKYGIIR